jgi:hypothetical protein
LTGTPDRLAARLLSEGEKTARYFKDLAPEQWGLEIYTEGSCWTVRQILAHFVAAETGFTRLVQNILVGGEGSPENFDLDAYNERKVDGLEAAAVEDLISRYIQNRAEFAHLIRQMSAEDLAKTGRHPFLGPASLEQMAKLAYRHNQIHIREIRRVMG